eukprot:GFKZ01000699.1.p1 GENE.GFKZ01000699.1~~GFKZ01000699.1.p1  ORF type:complete len:228 (+),score=22.07 GFKZ01000699.1:217-900(+)
MSDKYDAVIIPGGGLEPGTNQPQPWVRARLDAAIKLSSRTKYFVVLSRGTTHRSPPFDARGFPILESEASARYLLKHGIDDPGRILLDAWSLDTIGNAFFTRSMICEPMKLKTCCVITSAFHMARTRAIFDWVFSLDGAEFRLDYLISPNVGLDDAQHSARSLKEQNSLRALQENTVPRVKTLGELSSFLFREHRAYNAEQVLEASSRPDSADVSAHDNDKAMRSTY